MRIEDLKINDVVKCKTDKNDNIGFVTNLSIDGLVTIQRIGSGSWDTTEAPIEDVRQVEVTEQTLQKIGALKNPLVNEFVITLNNINFAIRKDLSSQMWICSKLDRYKPPYRKARFISEIQDFLYTNYKVSFHF